GSWRPSSGPHDRDNPVHARVMVAVLLAVEAKGDYPAPRTCGPAPPSRALLSPAQCHDGAPRDSHRERTLRWPVKSFEKRAGCPGAPVFLSILTVPAAPPALVAQRQPENHPTPGDGSPPARSRRRWAPARRGPRWSRWGGTRRRAGSRADPRPPCHLWFPCSREGISVSHRRPGSGVIASWPGPQDARRRAEPGQTVRRPKAVG